MKKTILAMAALFAFTLAAQAQQPIAPTAPSYEYAVQVNGKSEMKVTPDEIYIAITIKDGDMKNQNVDQIEGRMKSDFRALGIDLENNLHVTSMANSPKRRSDVDTRRSYELKVGDSDTLGRVFEALGEIGVSDARVTKVSHSRMEEFRGKVRAEAVQDAQKNAVTLAEAIGQSIGKAVWIYDNGYYENSPVPVMRAYGGVMAVADAAPAMGFVDKALDMQDITLNYSISAKFILNRE